MGRERHFLNQKIPSKNLMKRPHKPLFFIHFLCTKKKNKKYSEQQRKNRERAHASMFRETRDEERRFWRDARTSLSLSLGVVARDDDDDDRREREREREKKSKTVCKYILCLFARAQKFFRIVFFFSSSSSLSKRTTRDAFEQQQQRHEQKRERKRERERDLFFPFTHVKMRF